MRAKKPKLSPTIFTRAAELFDQQPLTSGRSGCCLALEHALREAGTQSVSELSYSSRHHKFFDAVFPCPPHLVFHFGLSRESGTEENVPHRVFALLLCAELVRDGFTTEDFQ